MTPEEYKNLKIGDELVSINDIPFFTRGIRVKVKGLTELGPRVEGIKNNRVYDKGIPGPYMDYYELIKKIPKTLMDLKIGGQL